ncbi:hypothetical protein [Thalassolituus sp. UBA3500]|uniref:hypothetical protein n=1 Tax=Thalassolituus sp. UBA3500 TaxID=1947664 RepID=UPI000C0D0896|nr:hypothetical protein [Thalassolituus sp. UBA3500]MBN57044.1 hypothetical protein [Oceanospirillaceae bacterium]
MLEVIEGILRGFAALIRASIEAGLPAISLPGTGRFMIRVLYPPHWFCHIEYHERLEIFFGAVTWSLYAFGAWYLGELFLGSVGW